MQLFRPADLTTSPPPESSFTGDVQIGAYFPRPAPSHVVSAFATFAPGARTPWKLNPLGQSVVVIDGAGRAQSRGGNVVEIRAGDLLWFAPGVEHWEGARPDQAMTYVALHEGSVQFVAPVTDAEYLAAGR